MDDLGMTEPEALAGAPVRKRRQIRAWNDLPVRNSHASRNRNPGNLRGSGPGGFAVFKSDEEGWVALQRDIEIKRTGQSKAQITDPDGKKRPLLATSTLGELMSVYAPPHENNTAAYAGWLAKELGVSTSTPINQIDNEKLSHAIATYEDRNYWEAVQSMQDDPTDIDPPASHGPKVYSLATMQENQNRLLHGNEPEVPKVPHVGTGFLSTIQSLWQNPGASSPVNPLALTINAAKMLGRIGTESIDTALDLVVDVGADALNSKGPKQYTRGDVAETPDTRKSLGERLVGEAEWAAWYTQPDSTRNPIKVGDERRNAVFGAKPDGAAGMAEDFIVFGVHQYAAWQALGPAKMTALVKMEVTAGMAAFSSMEAHAEGLTNILQDNAPEAVKPWLDWLAVSEDDGVLEGRAKHAMEMLLVGRAFGIALEKGVVPLAKGGAKLTKAGFQKFWSGVKILRAGVRAVRKVGTPEEFVAAVEESALNASPKAAQTVPSRVQAANLEPVEMPAQPVDAPVLDVPEQRVVTLEAKDGSHQVYPLDPEGRPIPVGETPAPKAGWETPQTTPEVIPPVEVRRGVPIPEHLRGTRPGPGVRDLMDELGPLLKSNADGVHIEGEPGLYFLESGVKVEFEASGSKSILLRNIKAMVEGQKQGGAVMRHIIEMADRHGVIIELQASPYGEKAMSPENLKRFYNRYGFRETRPGEAHMIRYPGDEGVATVIHNPDRAPSAGAYSAVPEGDGFVIAQDGVPMDGSPVFETFTAADAATETIVNEAPDAARQLFIERFTASVGTVLERYGLNGKNAGEIIKGIDFNFKRVNSPDDAKALINVISKLLREQMEVARNLGFKIENQKIITALRYGGKTMEEALALVQEAGENTHLLYADIMGSESVQMQLVTEFKRLSQILEENPSDVMAAVRQANIANTLADLAPATAELHSNVGRALRAAGESTPIEGIEINWGNVADDLHARRTHIVKSVKPVVQQAETALQTLTESSTPEAVETATRAVESMTEATEQLLDSSLEVPETLKQEVKKRIRKLRAKVRGKEPPLEPGEKAPKKPRKPRKPQPKKAPDLFAAIREAQELMDTAFGELGLKKKNGTRAIREEVLGEGSQNSVPMFTQDLSTAGAPANPVKQFLGSAEELQKQGRPLGNMMDTVAEAEESLEQLGRDLAEKRSGRAAEAAAEKKAASAAKKKVADPNAPNAAEMKTGVDDLIEMGQTGRGENSAPLTPSAPKEPWKAPAGSGIYAGMTRDEIKGLAKAVIMTDGDPRVVAAFLQGRRTLQTPAIAEALGKQGVFDHVFGARLRMMLYGLTTHETNIISALNQGFLKPAEMFFSSVLRRDWATASISRDLFTSAFSELKDGIKFGWKAMRNGRVLDPEVTYMSERVGLSKVPYAGVLYDAPLIALGAEDAMGKHWLYRQATRATWLQRGRVLVSKGVLTPAQLGSYVDEGMRHIYNVNSGAWLDPSAITYAREALFQNVPEKGLGRALVNLAQDKSPAGRLFKWINPFVKVGFNLTKWYVQHTPVIGRLASQSLQEDLAAGGLRAAQAKAKLDAGGAMYATAALLSMSGHLTGGGPSDPEMRRLWLEAGNQPYSVRTPDGTQVSYRRLEPFASILGVTADVVTMAGELKDNELQDFMTGVVLVLGKNATSKTYTQGMHDILSAFDGTETKALSLLSTNIGSMVPNIISQTNTDPDIRELHHWYDGIIRRIPGWSKTLEPRQNLMGEPMLKPAHMQTAWNIFTVSKAGDTQQERVIGEVFEIGRAIPRIPEKVWGTEEDLTDAEMWKTDGSPRFESGRPKSPFYRWQELIGQNDSGPGRSNFINELDELVSSSRWEELRTQPSLEDGGARYIAVKNIYQRRRDEAWGQLLLEYPALADHIHESGQELILSLTQ